MQVQSLVLKPSVLCYTHTIIADLKKRQDLNNRTLKSRLELTYSQCGVLKITVICCSFYSKFVPLSFDVVVIYSYLRDHKAKLYSSQFCR